MSTTSFEKAKESAMERFPDAEENAYRLDSIAALLGANEEWEGADFLEYIKTLIGMLQRAYELGAQSTTKEAAE